MDYHPCSATVERKEAIDVEDCPTREARVPQMWTVSHFTVLRKDTSKVSRRTQSYIEVAEIRAR